MYMCVSRGIKMENYRVEGERSRSFPPQLFRKFLFSEQRFGRRIDQRNCQVDVGDGGSSVSCTTI